MRSFNKRSPKVRGKNEPLGQIFGSQQTILEKLGLRPKLEFFYINFIINGLNLAQSRTEPPTMTSAPW